MVAAAVNLLACHLYKNGEWQGLLHFLFYFIYLYSTSLFLVQQNCCRNGDCCLPRLLGRQRPSFKSHSFVNLAKDVNDFCCRLLLKVENESGEMQKKKKELWRCPAHSNLL
jgi:hypothetical protein